MFDIVFRLTQCPDVQLDGVEFSALPSGLHLVERDVVYVRPNTLLTTRRSRLFRKRLPPPHTATSQKTPSAGFVSSTGARPPSKANAASASPPSVSSSRLLCVRVPGDTSLRSRNLRKRYTPCPGRRRVSYRRVTGHLRSDSSMSVVSAARTWAAQATGTGGARKSTIWAMG
jgi:hypothetical protein